MATTYQPYSQSMIEAARARLAAQQQQAAPAPTPASVPAEPMPETSDTPFQVSLQRDNGVEAPPAQQVKQLADQAVASKPASDLEAKIQEHVKEVPDENKSDTFDMASLKLQAVKNAMSQAPEQEREALRQQEMQKIQERADIQNRGLSTSDKIVMAILGAAPGLMNAVSPGARHGNETAAAGMQNVQNYEHANALQTKGMLDQKDQEIQSVRDQQKTNQTDLTNKNNHAFELAKQDIENKAKYDEENGKSDPNASKLTISQRKQAYQLADKAVSAGQSARQSFPRTFEAIANINNTVGIIDSKARALMGKSFFSLNKDDQDKVLNSMDEQSKAKFSTGVAQVFTNGAPTESQINILKTQGGAVVDINKLLTRLQGGEPVFQSNNAPQLRSQLDIIKEVHDLMRAKLERIRNANSGRMPKEYLNDPGIGKDLKDQLSSALPESIPLEDNFKKMDDPNSNTVKESSAVAKDPELEKMKAELRATGKHK